MRGSDQLPFFKQFRLKNDSLQEDPGSILMCYDLKDKKEYFTGISMRGPSYCGEPGLPALYEYLKYRDFELPKTMRTY